MIRTQFEETRVKCGLTKSQLLGLLGLSRESQLDENEPEYAEELTHIADEYTRYIERSKKAIDWEFKQPAHVLEGKPVISTVQAARALGVGEFHLSNLRDRRKLIATPFGRRAFYTRDALLKFVREQQHTKGHSSLSGAFVRWYQLEHSDRGKRLALA